MTLVLSKVCAHCHDDYLENYINSLLRCIEPPSSGPLPLEMEMVTGLGLPSEDHANEAAGKMVTNLANLPF